MEQKSKRVTLRNTFLFLWVAFNIIDIITTIVALVKHGYQYESNLIYSVTHSLTLLFSLKIIATLLIVYTFIKIYPRMGCILHRYCMIYAFVLIVFIFGFASINNLIYYNSPVGELGESMTLEEKAKFNAKAAVEMTYLTQIGPKNMQIVPLLPLFVFINVVQFAVWQSFETHGWRPKNVERISYNNVNIDGIRFLEE